jgi:hypothetical protein
MHRLRMEMLERFNGRYRALVASYEEMGMKRARTDGLLSLLVGEMGEALGEEQRQMLEEIITFHESLWSSSPVPRGRTALDDCRIHTCNSVIFRTVYVDQEDEEVGTVLINSERVRVFVVKNTNGRSGLRV